VCQSYSKPNVGRFLRHGECLVLCAPARQHYQLLVQLGGRHGVLCSHSSFLPESVRLLQTESEKSTRKLSTRVRRCRVSDVSFSGFCKASTAVVDFSLPCLHCYYAWLPCVAEADIILLSCDFFYLSVFFFFSSPNLSPHSSFFVVS